MTQARLLLRAVADALLDLAYHEHDAQPAEEERAVLVEQLRYARERLDMAERERDDVYQRLRQQSDSGLTMTPELRTVLVAAVKLRNMWNDSCNATWNDTVETALLFPASFRRKLVAAVEAIPDELVKRLTEETP